MTICKYNNSGSHLFIADKDSKTITVIDTNTKIILGNYTGHNGVIWNLDISDDTKTMISLSGDMSIIKWNLISGEFKKNIVKSSPKDINILSTENLYVISFDPISKKSVSSFQIYNLETDELLLNYDDTIEAFEAFEVSKVIDNTVGASKDLPNNPKRITTINFLNKDNLFLTYDNGYYAIFDIKNKKFIKFEKIHDNSIRAVSFNKDKTKLITSSIDCTCKIINLSNYVIETVIVNIVPCNYAVFSPIKNYIIVGGGIDAMLVAQKSNNDFTSRFYSARTGKFISSIGGHFGPIRYIDFHPNGKCYSTASQDGIVRLNYLDTVDQDLNDNQNLNNNQITFKFINDINIPLECENNKKDNKNNKEDNNNNNKEETKKECKLYTFASRTKETEREYEKKIHLLLK